MKAAVFLIGLALTGAACGSSPQASPPPSFENGPFQIDLPNGWQRVDPTPPGIDALITQNVGTRPDLVAHEEALSESANFKNGLLKYYAVGMGVDWVGDVTVVFASVGGTTLESAGAKSLALFRSTSGVQATGSLIALPFGSAYLIDAPTVGFREYDLFDGWTDYVVEFNCSVPDPSPCATDASQIMQGFAATP